MITVISAWRNEAVIAPYFLSHYRRCGVDRFVILLDSSTTDDTLKYLTGNDIEVIPLVYKNGFDEEIKVASLNNFYISLTDGWVICVDADELIFNDSMNLNLSLDTSKGQVIYSDMAHPFRHTSDLDLDPSKPAIEQRIHGTHTLNLNEMYKKYGEGDCTGAYNKPVAVKAGLRITWSVGNHILYGAYEKENNRLLGAHWKYADPVIIKNWSQSHSEVNMSEASIRRQHNRHWRETCDEALKIAADHVNDDMLWKIN